MAEARARIDVASEILGARQMECLRCLHTDSVAKFSRTITAREGLMVIYCHCPRCQTDWRRIDVGRAAA